MKYKSIKDFSTTDWGKTAITGLLAGPIAQFTSNTILLALLSFMSLLGLISLCVWIYRKIKKI